MKYELRDLLEDIRDFDYSLGEVERVSRDWDLSINVLPRGMVEE